MTRFELIFPLGSLLLFGCMSTDPETGVQPGTDSIAVTEEYEQRFVWSEPVPCDVFLHRRMTDESARIVEYDARIGDREYSIMYSIQESDDLPLRVDLVGVNNDELFSLVADEETVRVLDEHGEVAFEVQGYAGPRGQTEVRDSGSIDAAGGLQLLACALPVRAQLGSVPAFLQNRASGGQLPSDPDVVAQPDATAPIIDWQSKLAFLGVYLLGAACTQPGGWDCACFEWDDQLAGKVTGWCDPETPETSSKDLLRAPPVR